MKLDGHIHIEEGTPDPDGLLCHLAEAGLEGGVLISLPPPSFRWLSRPRSYLERLDNLMAWTNNRETLVPLFWIDPKSYTYHLRQVKYRYIYLSTHLFRDIVLLYVHS